MKIADKHRWALPWLCAALLVTACGDDSNTVTIDGGGDASFTNGDGGFTTGDGGFATGDGGFTTGDGDGGAINGGSTADAATGDAGVNGGDAMVDPMLESIDVTPTNPTAAVGTTLQLTATGTYSDASTADLTAEVTWSSAAEGIASVSNETDSAGVAAAQAPGEALLTATLGDVAGSTTLTVSDAGLESITVMPAEPSAALGTTVQFSAMGNFSDGSSQELSEQVTWTSSSEDVAIVDNEGDSKGLAVTLATGTTSVSASLNEVTGETTFTVTDAELLAISLEPAAPTLAAGTQVMLSAVGLYTDASKQDVTEQATWATGDELVATVSELEGEKATVTGQTAGQTAVTASVGELEGSTTVTVTDATLVSLALEPGQTRLALGTTLHYLVYGTFSDDTIQDLTPQVTWDSSDENVATLSNAEGTRGLATSVATGTTIVSAEVGGETASGMLTVTDATVETIEVDPASATLADGTTRQFRATGSFSDDTVQDLTTQVTWTSEDTDVASIADDGMARGELPGETTITASMGGQSGEASLEVTDAELQSLVVTPLDESVAAGTRLSFTAMGTFSDDTKQDVTDQVTWASDEETVANIRNGALDPGLATAIAAGSATITATLGEVNAGTTLTVTDAALESIAVTPVEASVGAGSTVQFLASGTFSDGSEQDLTDTVAWSAEPGSVASVSNAPGRKGLATAREEGTATLTATLDGVEGTSELTVTDATLDAIRVEPVDPSIATGTAIQLVAVGVFSDASEQDLTGDVTWVSDDTDIADVSNALFSRGEVTGLMAGTATITAMLDAVEGSSAVQVVDRTLESILVTPEDVTLEAGSDQQFIATGVFSDDSEQDLTRQVLWDTEPLGVAFIRSFVGSEGLATGVAPGETTVTATYGDVVGSSALTVEGTLDDSGL